MAAKTTAAHCVVIDTAILRWQEWMTTTADDVLEQESIVLTGDFYGAPPLQTPDPASPECIKTCYVLQIMRELSADASCLLRDCQRGYVSKSLLLTFASLQQGVARLESHLAEAAVMQCSFDTVPSVAELADYFKQRFWERLCGLTSLATRWNDLKAHTELSNPCSVPPVKGTSKKPAAYYNIGYSLEEPLKAVPADTHRCCHEQPCTCFKMHTYTNANMLFIFATAKSIDMNAGIMYIMEAAPDGHIAKSPCAKKNIAWRRSRIAQIAAGIASISAHLASRCSQ